MAIEYFFLQMMWNLFRFVHFFLVCCNFPVTVLPFLLPLFYCTLLFVSAGWWPVLPTPELWPIVCMWLPVCVVVCLFTCLFAEREIGNQIIRSTDQLPLANLLSFLFFLLFSFFHLQLSTLIGLCNVYLDCAHFTIGRVSHHRHRLQHQQQQVVISIKMAVMR